MLRAVAMLSFCNSPFRLISNVRCLQTDIFLLAIGHVHLSKCHVLERCNVAIDKTEVRGLGVRQAGLGTHAAVFGGIARSSFPCHRSNCGTRAVLFIHTETPMSGVCAHASPCDCIGWVLDDAITDSFILSVGLIGWACL